MRARSQPVQRRAGSIPGPAPRASESLVGGRLGCGGARRPPRSAVVTRVPGSPFRRRWPGARSGIWTAALEGGEWLGSIVRSSLLDRRAVRFSRPAGPALLPAIGQSPLPPRISRRAQGGHTFGRCRHVQSGSQSGRGLAPIRSTRQPRQPSDAAHALLAT